MTEHGAGWRPLFILFNYEMCVNVVSQAVRAAWVNIWGVRHVSGTPIMFIVLFASHAFAPLSASLEFVF